MSALPRDPVAATAWRIKAALDRLQVKTISLALVEWICPSGIDPQKVVGQLGQSGCSVFFYGAYRHEVEAGRAASRDMLEAALAGKVWIPPVKPAPEPVLPPAVTLPAPSASAPVVAPFPQPTSIPLDRDGHLDLDARPVDRLEAMRRFVAARRNGSGS